MQTKMNHYRYGCLPKTWTNYEAVIKTAKWSDISETSMSVLEIYHLRTALSVKTHFRREISSSLNYKADIASNTHNCTDIDICCKCSCGVEPSMTIWLKIKKSPWLLAVRYVTILRSVWSTQSFITILYIHRFYFQSEMNHFPLYVYFLQINNSFRYT